MSTSPGADEVARQLVAGIVAGDVDAVAQLYDDEIAVWRNFDGRTLAKHQALAVVRFLSTLAGVRYEELRVAETPRGFVQQHVLCCEAPDGTAVRAAACLVAEVSDGRITRIDEYVDSAQMAPLLRTGSPRRAARGEGSSGRGTR